MNREIKFRAWDTRTGEWVGSIGFGMKPNFLTDGDPRNPIQIMQFTGLRDKNGVEIYEGDIVEVKWNSNYPQCRGVIEYAEGSFCSWVGLGGSSCGYIKCTDESISVIGNIHQNPELLEAK